MKSGTSLQARPRATVGPPIENADNAELMNAERALCQAAARASSHIFNMYNFSAALDAAHHRTAQRVGTGDPVRPSPRRKTTAVSPAVFFRVVEANFRFQIYFTPQSAAGCLPSTFL